MVPPSWAWAKTSRTKRSIVAPSTVGGAAVGPFQVGRRSAMVPPPEPGVRRHGRGQSGPLQGGEPLAQRVDPDEAALAHLQAGQATVLDGLVDLGPAEPGQLGRVL